MIEKLKRVIDRLIMSKYSNLVEVEVSDLFGDYGQFKHQEQLLGSTYSVEFTTNKCLDMGEMVEIDTEVKTLFKMMSPENLNPFSVKEPKVSCYFDCGDGEGFTFHSPYGYKH
jgi:hypothetical protein